MTVQIRVFGPGCINCQRLAENARRAVEESGADATVEEVHDMRELMAHGVLTTPALMIDGELVMAGRVATVPQIQELLTAHA